MSSVKYENFEIEESTSKKQCDLQRSKPFVTPSGRVQLPRDQVADPVAEVLDFELAQGSMPV